MRRPKVCSGESKLKNFLFKPKVFLKEEKGSVLVFITLSMIVLLAFGAGVMDIGMLYENRRQIQNGADSAALAGAGELGRYDLSVTQRQDLAINTALDYAQRNGISLSQIEPGYPQVTCEPAAYNNNCDPSHPYYYNAVKMAASRHLNLMVARLFNNSMGDVGASATAIVAPALPTEELWPFGVSECGDWDLDKVDCKVPEGVPIGLKIGSPPSFPGNFQPLDWPPTGGGASEYEDAIKYGYGSQTNDYIKPSLPWCGTSLSPCSGPDNPHVRTKTGNVVGPTITAINYLLNMAAVSGQDDPASSWNEPTDTCTWPGAPKRPSDLPPPYGTGSAVPPPSNWVGSSSVCYRVGIIPILSQASFDAVTGQSPVDIIGWGAFYIIGYTTGGGQGNTKVWGYYTDMAKVTAGRFSVSATGLWAARLWR